MSWCVWMWVCMVCECEYMKWGEWMWVHQCVDVRECECMVCVWMWVHQCVNVSAWCVNVSAWNGVSECECMVFECECMVCECECLAMTVSVFEFIAIYDDDINIYIGYMSQLFSLFLLSTSTSTSTSTSSTSKQQQPGYCDNTTSRQQRSGGGGCCCWALYGISLTSLLRPQSPPRPFPLSPPPLPLSPRIHSFSLYNIRLTFFS